MPYYHTKCGGRISWLPVRCKKCGQKWSLRVWFGLGAPKDMKHRIERAKPAKWAEGTLAGSIAGVLPDFPRWVRILIFLSSLALAVVIIYQVVK